MHTSTSLVSHRIPSTQRPAQRNSSHWLLNHQQFLASFQSALPMADLRSLLMSFTNLPPLHNSLDLARSQLAYSLLIKWRQGTQSSLVQNTTAWPLWLHHCLHLICKLGTALKCHLNLNLWWNKWRNHQMNKAVAHYCKRLFPDYTPSDGEVTALHISFPFISLVYYNTSYLSRKMTRKLLSQV